MKKKDGIFSLLKPYKGLVFILLLFTILSNGLNLWLPKIIAKGIDSFSDHESTLHPLIVEFTIAIACIFIFAYLQSVIQTYTSERVAKDIRTKLSGKIAKLDTAFIDAIGPEKLLTNLTIDVDAIKMFVSQAIVSIISSLLIIIGASILLLTINWRLALCIIAIIPIIGITFFLVLKKVRPLFMESRKVIDGLNKVMNESILGAAIIRVVNAQQLEYDRFLTNNEKAKNFGLAILRLFAGLIPVITFTANMATLAILAVGGHFVISGSMSLGDFAAFNSYLSMLIFPILVIGFMSNVIAQATTSFERIRQILESADPSPSGIDRSALTGAIDIKDLLLVFDQKPVLREISFSIKPGTKTAIIGPTAAGKTQLLHVLMGLSKPTSGTVLFDGKSIEAFDQESFHAQIGFVFQDSVLFNMSIRDNIAFGASVTADSLEKSIQTAELKEFIDSLPDQLDTLVSERGTSLSGGQKQRLMLARALAMNPKILLLDDFTARVDSQTEAKILKNIKQHYPHITLLSVTQKIATVEHYDQLILLMEGEIVAIGKHGDLMHKSPEYVQLYRSQQSTSNYELQS